MLYEYRLHNYRGTVEGAWWKGHVTAGYLADIYGSYMWWCILVYNMGYITFHARSSWMIYQDYGFGCCGTSWCLHDNYHQMMFCTNTGDAYVRSQGGGTPGCPWDLPDLVVTICRWLRAHSVSIVWLWKMTLAQKRWLDYILMEFCKIDICTGGAMTMTSWGNIS